MNTNPDQNERNLKTAISETQYVLRRWQFAASDRGVLWITPNAVALSPEEFAALFSLLRRCCDTRFPSIVVIDFKQVAIRGEQWNALIGVIEDFAASINRKCRLVAGEGAPVSAVYLFGCSNQRIN